jgi:hypothetical protein
VHRPRGGAALSPEDERLPQAWVPRVVNLALAAVLLLFLVPLGTHLGGLATSVQVLLVLLAVPLGLLVVACLASAARPGSLGRLVRRVRASNS